MRKIWVEISESEFKEKIYDLLPVVSPELPYGNQATTTTYTDNDTGVGYRSDIFDCFNKKYSMSKEI